MSIYEALPVTPITLMVRAIDISEMAGKPTLQPHSTYRGPIVNPEHTLVEILVDHKGENIVIKSGELEPGVYYEMVTSGRVLNHINATTKKMLDGIITFAGEYYITTSKVNPEVINTVEKSEVYDLFNL